MGDSIKRRGRGLGHPADDPFGILRVAEEELKQASAIKDRERGLLAHRQVAEKVNLAMVAAVERTLGQQIKSGRSLERAVSEVGRKVVRDAGFARRFNGLRDALHGKCYYQRECPRGFKMAVRIGEAKNMIESILGCSAPEDGGADDGNRPLAGSHQRWSLW